MKRRSCGRCVDSWADCIDRSYRFLTVAVRLAVVRDAAAPAALHIIFSLARGDRHEYGIMQEIARQSGGSYKLGPGTLYDNLQKFMANGIVDDAPAPASNDDPRRKYYRLTTLGRGVLKAEVVRLESVIREAKRHLKPRRA
jgi:DNA-binding PadR family transcriptional regulator